MSMSRRIIDALDDLARSDARPSSLAVDDGPCRLTLLAPQATSIGVSCEALAFAPRSVSDLEGTPERFTTSEDLVAWGNRLMARMTYLVESIKLHEVDHATKVAIYRSTAPTHRENRRTYYEITIDATGSLRLIRYAHEDGTRGRTPVPCLLTNDMLECLADDLAAAAT